MGIFLKWKKGKPTIWLLFLLFGIVAFGQESPEFVKYKAKYPDARRVRLLEETTFKIYREGDSIRIEREYYEKDLYLDETANYGSKKSISYSSFYTIEDLEASSYQFEDGDYEEYEVSEFKERDELEDSFYDDARSINFIFPNLKKGSMSELSYTEHILNPRFLNNLYFGDYFPLEHVKVTLIVDEEIQMEFLRFNTETIDLNFTQQKKRGRNIYTWEAKEVPEFEYESNVPSYSEVFPHVIPKIASYEVNGKPIELSKNVGNLYQWYQSMVSNLNTDESDPELIKVVEELTASCETDLEKVKALYYWAQQNIKYIAFEYALGGFIPRDANDVFQKKFGDCKDNSSILKEMMEIANLKGRITWIGTRQIPYKYEEVPLPVVDNHMILTYIDGQDYYFLDATGRYTPFGYPTAFIQGKEALVADGPENYILAKVPEMPASANVLRDTTYLKIDHLDLIGTSKTEASGYIKQNFFQRLEELTSDKERKNFYNARLGKGNNKFLIENLEEINKFDYDKNFIMEYSFKLQDYSKRAGEEIYVNLNLNQPLARFKIEEDRKYPVELNFKDQNEFTTLLEIPEGYEVDYIPENTREENKYLNAILEYEVKDNMVIYHHVVTTKFLRLDPQEQKELNEIVKKALKAYNEVIVLKKKS